MTTYPIDKRVEIQHHRRSCGGFWVRDLNGPFAIYTQSWDVAAQVKETFEALLRSWISRELTREQISIKSIELARAITDDPNQAEREYAGKVEREPNGRNAY